MSCLKYEKLNKKEKDIFSTVNDNHYTCPDCRNKLYQGPCGGCSVNYYCNSCGSRFNETVGFVQRINNACNAPDDVAKRTASIDRDKFQFTMKWFADRADEEFESRFNSRDSEGARDSLNRFNFWVNFAMKKFGISI